MRWLIDDNPFDYDFTRALAPLEPVGERDLIGPIEREWSYLYLFGQDYYEGGAGSLLGIDSRNGKILGLDVERSSAIYLLNSGIGEFIQMFLLFDSVLRSRQHPVQALTSAAKAIDRKGFAGSEWRKLADHLIKYPPRDRH